MNLYEWLGNYEGLAVMAESVGEAREKAKKFLADARVDTINVDVRPRIIEDGVYYWCE